MDQCIIFGFKRQEEKYTWNTGDLDYEPKFRIIIEGKHYHANMASVDYEPKLLVILSISFFLSYIFISSTGLVAALDPALLASEGKALLESGWSSDYSHLTSHRCKWTGIVCDRAGSITDSLRFPHLQSSSRGEIYLYAVLRFYHPMRYPDAYPLSIQWVELCERCHVLLESSNNAKDTNYFD